MAKYILRFGRKFDELQEVKDYIKSLTPDQVGAEYSWLSRQQITTEVESMYNLCQSALVHIQNNWSDTF